MKNPEKLNKIIYEKKKKLNKKTELYENSYKKRFLELYIKENKIRKKEGGLKTIVTEKERHEWADQPLIPLKHEIMELTADIEYYQYKLDIILKEEDKK